MKTCNRCKVEKPLVEFYKCKTLKDGLQRACKVCTRERKKIEARSAVAKETRKRWMEKNPEKLKQYSKSWAANNYEKSTKWQREHPEYQRAQTKKDVEQITDKYIKHCLRFVPGITKELIEAKRLHIQIIRKLKELKA